MLAIVENTRRKQLAWVEAILARTRLSPHRLSREAGFDHSTLSKFLNDPQNVAQLSTTVVEKLATLSGLTPYEVAAAEMPRGFSEAEAAPLNIDDADPMTARAVDAMRQDANGLDAWELRSRALDMAGYLPGDVLMVDLNARPHAGDAVCAQVYDMKGKAETVFRIFERPFLVAASSDRRHFKPHLIDNERVIVRGVVVASVRPRLSALAS